MKALLEILSGPAWTHLVMALLHSLWLGVLWVMALGLALRLAGNDPARRYNRSLAMLGGLVLSTLVAWGLQDVDWSTAKEVQPNVQIAEQVHETSANTTEASGVAEPSSVAPAAGVSWFGVCALIWAVGCGLMTIRLFASILESGRIRRASRIVTSGPVTELLHEVREKLGCSRVVRIATNAAVAVPAVAGIVSPVILLPASMMSGVPAEQLRAILLHELAHIRRHDYLVNLVQQAIEAFLFFNPAVWWINRQIRLEREACCDWIAAQASSERSYAATLAEFAEHAVAVQDSLQPAFPGDRQPSSLIERVRRLLVAGYQPVVRLPWHSSLAVLFLTGMLLFVAWRGTRLAVAFAADILTPEQRIEKIAELKALTGPEERTYTKKDNIRIAGRVRTEDGAPLPSGVYLSTFVKSPGVSSGFTGVRLVNGSFSHELEFGEVHLFASGGDKYGPALIGPLRTEPGGSITNIDLVLPKGFPAEIRVKDAKGQPVAGVQLEGQYQTPTSSAPIKATTDNRGIARLEHCISEPMRWTANRSGFQSVKLDNVRLNKESPFVVRLEPARIVTGQVLASGTQKPVSGARVKLIYRSDGGFQDAKSAPVVATTDERGGFQLDTLPDGTKNVVAVQADGFATKVVYDVSAGQAPLRVELGPPIYLAGRIEGDLERLGRFPDPVIYVANPVTIGDHTHSFNRTVPVEITNGVGYFSVSNLWEGIVAITAGGASFEYNLRSAKTNVLLRLAEPAGGPAERSVVVRFKTPNNAPPVRGQLDVTRASVEEPGVYRGEFMPVENNEVKFRVPVNSWLSWSTRGIVGYWTPAHSSHNVPAGEAPLVIEAPAIPAGAIHGSVRDSDGSEVGGVMISVIEAKNAPGKSPGSLGEVGKDQSTPDDGPTRFVAQPLPLGGKYLILAHRRNQYVASEVIELTEKNPIREIELRFVPGRELTGRVTDDQGKPLAHIPISLQYDSSYGHSFGITGFGTAGAPETGENGVFRISGLNPSLPGSYKIIVDQAFGFRPVVREISFGERLELKLQRAEVLKGTVVNDATGQPLAGAHFYVLVSDFTNPEYPTYLDADAASDAAGKFAFTRLSARGYTLNCRDGEIVSTRQLNLPMKQPMEVRLKPHAGARLFEKGELTANRVVGE